MSKKMKKKQLHCHIDFTIDRTYRIHLKNRLSDLNYYIFRLKLHIKTSSINQHNDTPKPKRESLTHKI